MGSRTGSKRVAYPRKGSGRQYTPRTAMPGDLLQLLIEETVVLLWIEPVVGFEKTRPGEQVGMGQSLVEGQHDLMYACPARFHDEERLVEKTHEHPGSSRECATVAHPAFRIVADRTTLDLRILAIQASLRYKPDHYRASRS